MQSAPSQLTTWQSQLAETRQEIALLSDPATRAATAQQFGLSDHLVAPYLEVLAAQERCLLRWIERAK